MNRQSPMFQVLLATTLLSPCLALAAEKPAENAPATQPATTKVPGLETNAQKAAYQVGRRDGATYRDNGLDCEALLRGIRDVMNGVPSPIPAAELKQASEEVRQKSVMNLMERFKKDKDATEAAMNAAPPPEAEKPAEPASGKHADEGKKFLEKNRSEKGVITTSSGLQFVILKEGNGAPPRGNESVVVNYRGTLLDGTEFDSSYTRGQPATFSITGVIKGWTEGLHMMKPGAKYKFFIPSDLAYGPAGSPPKIPANATLIFEVELISVVAAR